MVRLAIWALQRALAWQGAALAREHTADDVRLALQILQRVAR
jgi:hypothetical protein